LLVEESLTGEWGPDSANHCSWTITREQSWGTLQLAKMEACKDVVPVAEAKKAGNARL